MRIPMLICMLIVLPWLEACWLIDGMLVYCGLAIAMACVTVMIWSVPTKTIGELGRKLTECGNETSGVKIER